MRIEGAVRREQLASILFALLGTRPDSPNGAQHWRPWPWLPGCCPDHAR